MPTSLSVSLRQVLAAHPVRLMVMIIPAAMVATAINAWMGSHELLAITALIWLAVTGIWLAACASQWRRIMQKLPEALPVLSAKRESLLRPNEYGIVNQEAWHQEVSRFLSMHGMTEDDVGPLETSPFFKAVLAEINRRCKKREIPPNSGTQYEADCSEILERQGWSTWLTPPSGDKGVDIVAVKAGLKVALQCKNYKSPVGTRAVQEIIAGSEYEKADHAIVVSDAEFTRQARDLAASLGVLLLKRGDLTNLFDRLA